MTGLQNKELSILRETIRVIDALKLKYFLVCGTALGAVKYQGFIPWDDDIDIGLPRKDYDIFCERAQELLPSNLFLQNYRTDPCYPLIFSKVRDIHTTYIESNVSMRDICHGVYIDVFPLDGYPHDEKEQQRLEHIKRKFLLSSLCWFKQSPTWKIKILVFGQRLIGMHRNTKRRIERFEKEISKWKLEESVLWCNHGNWQGKLEYATKEQYGNGTFAIFEGIRVRIPEKYDEYLTQKYGDWRAELPKEQQFGHHYYDICDLSRPYTDYIERLSNGKIRMKTVEKQKN